MACYADQTNLCAPRETKMSFQPQNKLERSLMKAAEDPAHHPQFYKDLIESDVFIIWVLGPTILRVEYIPIMPDVPM